MAPASRQGGRAVLLSTMGAESAADSDLCVACSGLRGRILFGSSARSVPNRAEGLRKVPGDPGGKRPHFVLVHGVGRDRDDGQPFEFGHGADDPGGLVAVHDRHLDVHQDEIEAFAPLRADPERVEGLFAVAGRPCPQRALP